MGGWLADQIIGPILTWFTEMVIGALNGLWDLLSVNAFVSPDVTGLPQVTAFASTSLGIVNVCYVLAFLWTAILVMGRDTIQSQVGPGELIPRLVIGLIAADFAIPLCSTVIGLANAFTAALTSQDITAPGSMQQLRATTVSALDGQTGATAVSFLLLLIGLLIAVLTGVLLVQRIIRLGVLVVAVGISPIALALHGTPQTEGAAKLWWRTILGTLGTVVIQAVALHTTLRVFLNPDSNLRVLGLPIPGGEPAAVMNLLIVVFLNLPGSVGDMLAEARGYHFGLVLAHQNLSQVPRDTQLAISANARNKVFFSCVPEDAHQLARHTMPELDERDLSHLDAYRGACRLVVNSRETAAFTLRTNPPRALVGEATAVRQTAAAVSSPSGNRAANGPARRRGRPTERRRPGSGQPNSHPTGHRVTQQTRQEAILLRWSERSARRAALPPGSGWLHAMVPQRPRGELLRDTASVRLPPRCRQIEASPCR